jgi:hypothetical protein
MISRARELLEDDLLAFDAAAFLEAIVGHRDRRSHGGTVVRRQDRFEDRRAHGVAAAGDVERELGGERLDAGCASALPLGPQEAEVDAVVVGAAGERATHGVAEGLLMTGDTVADCPPAEKASSTAEDTTLPRRGSLEETTIFPCCKAQRGRLVF